MMFFSSPYSSKKQTGSIIERVYTFGKYSVKIRLVELAVLNIVKDLWSWF